jgi:transposase-like protein
MPPASVAIHRVSGGSSTRRKYANNPMEADHSQLKHRLRPMRGLRTDRTAAVIIAGHAFVQNLRRGHYELGLDAPPALRGAAAFAELAQVI